MPAVNLQFLRKYVKIYAMFEWKGIRAAGAVFDLDGTLIDSMEIWREIDEEFFAKRGMAVPEGYQDNIAHLGFRDVAAYTVDNFLPAEREEDVIAEWNEMCRRKYGNKGSGKYFKEGAADLLHALHARGVKMCVATASSPELFLPLLREGGVYGLFDGFVTVDDVRKNKSFPDIFLRAAQILGLPPQACVAFEDSLIALRAAKAAGLSAIAVHDPSAEKYEAGLREAADAYVFTFSDILKDLDKPLI